MLTEPLDKYFVKATLKALREGLGLRTVGDLLRHYPRRYAERGELTDLAALQIDEHVTVLARVAKVSSRPMRNRRGGLLEVEVTDGQGRITLTFFGQAWREKELRVGRVGLFSGKVGTYRGARQFIHPDYELLPAGELGPQDDDPAAVAESAESPLTFSDELIPVYRATAALPSWRVAQCVGTMLDLVEGVDDPLPKDVRLGEGLIPLPDALRLVHRPTTMADVTRGLARLRFDEAFVLQVLLAQRRAFNAAQPAVPRSVGPESPEPAGLLAAFDAALPFQLTPGQLTVGEQVAADLAQARPMNRLLQGEVGSGKTVVAVRAMLQVIDAGGQAALLAPTEVLAQQHHRSILELLGPLGEVGLFGAGTPSTKVGLLTGSTSTAVRRQVLLDAMSGEAGILVGTHALLEPTVRFHDLGLVVVDEQHRFGVEQRDAMRLKGRYSPHVLVMSATPIPRTVAMTVFGDLEVSTLRELPAGRAAIATHVVPVLEKPALVDRTWARVTEEVAAGNQVFVVCPRIGDEEGADASVANVRDTLGALSTGPLAGLRLDQLHGRMTAEAKDSVMRRFAAGKIDVLVATTVVEVGVDVPNATTMVILDADRFGVSQLHQLRGRVGRGDKPGLCLLVTSVAAESAAGARLRAVASTTDGFELSRLDLEQRREGDVLGSAQSGRRTTLRLLSPLRDEELIVRARDHARRIVAADPHLADHRWLAGAVHDLATEDSSDFVERG